MATEHFDNNNTYGKNDTLKNLSGGPFNPGVGAKWPSSGG